VLTRLDLVGFRNLLDASLRFQAEGVALIGRNAQGKTNLLEAIHYIEMLRSFRRARDEDLVTFGRDFFRLEASFGEGAGVEDTLAVAFRNSPRTKKVTLESRDVPRLGDAIGALGTVLFTPDDLRVVREGPADRRRFLDVVLSLNVPGYVGALQIFRNALAQRNAALRACGDATAVCAWDPVLTRSGGEVSFARARWIRGHADAFSRLYSQISGGLPAEIRYEPSVSGAESEGTPEGSADRYGVALASSRIHESRRRTTVVGPHRDDLRFSAADREGGRDLREYGSGGEQRTVALALRLLEAETLRESRGAAPILLLDDVFAELDDDRSGRVLHLLDDIASGQVILTAPKESDVQFRKNELAKWRIENGEIQC
jgi:DNA replication and repair protein RecF